MKENTRILCCILAALLVGFACCAAPRGVQAEGEYTLTLGPDLEASVNGQVLVDGTPNGEYIDYQVAPDTKVVVTYTNATADDYVVFAYNDLDNPEEDKDKNTLTFVMPFRNVTVSVKVANAAATERPVAYEVTVNGGYGSGMYWPGAEVYVEAMQPAGGGDMSPPALGQ